MSLSFFSLMPLMAVYSVHASISRTDNRSDHDNGSEVHWVSSEWWGLSLPGTARAVVLGMRIRTMPFPSIKGPCFHPARSADRPFGLVSNAGAMTLPHFATQTAIHSTLPSRYAMCAAEETHRGGLLCNLRPLQRPLESELGAYRT